MGPVRFCIVLLAVFLALSNARPTKDGESHDCAEERSELFSPLEGTGYLLMA